MKEDNLYNSLNEAERNANIGLAVPSLGKLFILKRAAYRWFIKILFKILKVVTINQRNFNLSVLDAFRSSIDAHNGLKIRFAEAKTQWGVRAAELEGRLGQQGMDIDRLQKTVDYLKHSLFQLEHKANDISEDTEKKGRSKLQNSKNEINHSLDSLYVFLEDNLRGSREEIKRRLNIYLPVIKKAGAGSKDSPILDIGCGRGEWLELLKDEGLYAAGLDLNGIMVKICKELELNAVQDEALSYLSRLSHDSMGAVTGFHLIEHYEFEFLIKLLEEILRVLKPGGLVILETPNPGNVLVGSCNFYLDPTHRKPLPGSLVKLILESRGFNKVKIINVNPYGDDIKIKNDDFETSKRFNEYFYGPQDYAVVGYKI